MANLITAQEVIELAFAENSNMREESISSTSIRIAEIKNIKPTFGNMYPLLGTTYADFTNGYIKPALAYFVKCEILSSIAIDMSNSGIAIANPQYQSAASDKQRQRLYDSEMSKAKVLLDDALAYISSHIEEFPDFAGTAPKQHYRNGGLILGGGVPARPTQVIGNPVSRQEFDVLTEKVNEKVDKVEGKGLSTNDYTNEERAEVTKIKGKADTVYVKGAIDRVNANVEALEDRLDDVEDKIKAIDNPFDDKGYYPKLTAGFANNLVGRGEATAEEFAFRPSAGEERSIGDEGAKITKIKGNSVVWNQLRNDTIISNTSFSVSQANRSFTFSKATSEYARVNIGKTAVLNHKYLLRCEVVENTFAQAAITSNNNGMTHGSLVLPNSAGCYATIIEKTLVATPNEWQFMIYDPDYAEKSAKIKDIVIIDLTQMFGAGNEPETVEDFYARIPSGIDINEYNKGEIISMHTEAIKTVGFNAWDEELESGYLSTTDGTTIANANKSRSKNFIKVLGGYDYYFFDSRGIEMGVLIYGKNKEYLGVYSGGVFRPSALGSSNVTNKIIKLPVEVFYIKFRYESAYSVDLRGGICIHLSHTGVNNGKYKPYTPFTRELSVIKKYFPNGMRSAGTAHDSIEWDSTKQKWVAVQRIGEFDLGDSQLIWQLIGERFLVYNAFAPNTTILRPMWISNTKVPNLLCANYAPDSASNVYVGKNDKVVSVEDGTRLNVRDTTYTDAVSFKTAMQGVKLYYELAEPIVTEIDESLNLNYYVEDFGTEEAISSVPSAPFSADIIYPFNAVDTIRNNALAIQELQRTIATMQAQMASLTTIE